jgi:polar amino acid transport system substrate-binding protein
MTQERSKPIITILLVILLAIGASGFAAAQSPNACGNGGTNDGIHIPTAKESPTIARICKDGVLRGGIGPFAPYGFQDSTGTYRGPGAEIIGPAIAKSIGVRFEIVPVGWDTIVAGLQSGRYEMIATALTYTVERTKVVDYVLYSVGGTCYLVRKESNLKTLDDLNSPNVTIGVFTGTSWETDLPKAFPKAKFDASVQGQGGGYRVTDVLAKRIDAAPIDNVAALAFQANYPSVRVIPAGDECLTNPKPLDRFGFGVPKGDSAFKDLVTAIVNKNKNEIDAMLKKYMSPTYISVGHE